MPIYEYQCISCESRFEALRRVNDDGANLSCPKCGNEKVEKQFSVFATSGESGSLGGGNNGCSPTGFS